jgi:hypothetical protein
LGLSEGGTEHSPKGKQIDADVVSPILLIIRKKRNEGNVGV